MLNFSAHIPLSQVTLLLSLPHWKCRYDTPQVFRALCRLLFAVGRPVSRINRFEPLDEVNRSLRSVIYHEAVHAIRSQDFGGSLKRITAALDEAERAGNRGLRLEGTTLSPRSFRQHSLRCLRNSERGCPLRCAFSFDRKRTCEADQADCC